MAYNPKWHKDNLARLLAKKRARRLRNAAIIAERRRGGCSRCPESAPCCLDFHHLDPAKKLFALGSGQALDASVKRLQSEISKCILLCANCHRKEHANV